MWVIKIPPAEVCFLFIDLCFMFFYAFIFAHRRNRFVLLVLNQGCRRLNLSPCFCQIKHLLICFSIGYQSSDSRIFFFVRVIDAIRGLVAFFLPDIDHRHLVFRARNKMLDILFHQKSYLLDSRLSWDSSRLALWCRIPFYHVLRVSVK